MIAVAGPPPAVAPAKPAPAAPRPDDLAFELGRAHALRQLCLGRGDAEWRDRMSALLAAEQATGDRRQALVLRFNAGFADASAAFKTCTPGAETALRETARRGAALARTLSGG